MVYVELETKIFNKSKMISNLSSKQLDRSLFDLEVNRARSQRAHYHLLHLSTLQLFLYVISTFKLDDTDFF